MNESEVPAPLPAAAFACEPCEACAGFERHNAHACGKPAGHTVSGVALCSYHNAIRAYVPVLYLTGDRAMNRAGVVGSDAAAQPPDPGAGAVDALVAAADAIEPASFVLDGAGSMTPEQIIAAIDSVLGAEPPRPSTLPPVPPGFERVESYTSIPPSEAEPAPRACMPPPAEPIPPPPFMSTDSATRKRMPVASGFLAYFADAVMLASMVSVNGANKHCGGVLRWDKSKSADEPDAEVRHMLDVLRGLPPDAGLEELGMLGHYASKLWRAAADCQRAADEARAKYERGEDWRK